MPDVDFQEMENDDVEEENENYVVMKPKRNPKKTIVKDSRLFVIDENK